MATGNPRGVVTSRHSPYAKLHGVPIRAVKMGDGFWSARRAINVEKSIPTMLAELEQHGMVDNFLRLEGKKEVARRGPLYTDSDLYKWMEAVAFVLQSGDDPKLRAEFDRLTGIILAAQEPSGYLNTYWSEERTASASPKCTGRTSCIAWAICCRPPSPITAPRATANCSTAASASSITWWRTSARKSVPRSPAIPNSKWRWWSYTAPPATARYLDFAGYLLSGVERERLHLTDRQVQYMFSGKPFTSRTEFEGHAVRAMYASCGATDYYIETGDSAYRKTLETLWGDLVNRKMYITGGVGSR